MTTPGNSQIMRTIPLLITIFSLSLPAYAKYSGGTGEPNDPYQIATAEDLILLGETPDDYDKHFILTADIDLSDLHFDRAVIAPDTNDVENLFQGIPFACVFDGNGHTISHLTIQGQGCLGLFGKLESGANVRNLGVVDVNIGDSGLYVGGLAGQNSGEISVCYSTGLVNGDRCVGGLVGCNTGNGEVTNCSSNCMVSGFENIGGLLGHNGHDYSGWVTRCFSTGLVAGFEDVGGLIGDNDANVTDSFWDMETSDRAHSDGGIGKTTAEMQTAATFLEAGWDFVGETENGDEDVWNIVEGQTYPLLSWQKYSGGTGEPNDPYQIATAEDLILLGETPEDYDKHFILTADIDLDPNLSGRKVFDKAVIAPDTYDMESGFQGTSFTGGLDGNDYAIKNLTISGRGYLGLFGQLGLGAMISNLGLEAVDVNGTSDDIGGLAAYNEGHIIKNYSTGAVSGDDEVGGLVGNNLGYLTECYSTGLVNGDENVGGLVGCNSGSITTSNSTCTVIGGEYVGGLLGHNYSSGQIIRCFSTGLVTGFDEGVGGLVGRNSAGSIKMSYSAGMVTGNEDVGGLVGSNWNGNITLSFWDIDTSCQATSVGGTGKTTAEMQTAAMFLEAGWDFVGETINGPNDVWKMWEGYDYPRLIWEPGPNTPLVFVDINDPGFYGQMSKYEVTNAQYCDFLNAALTSGDITIDGNDVYGANGSNSGEDYAGQRYYRCDGSGYTGYGATNGGAARIHYSEGTFNVDSGFGNHPVTYVSWYGAMAFANYYGYYLPAEEQWQAVADYDGTYIYGCGQIIDPGIANYRDSEHPYGTTPVGSFGIYGYGMSDMAGNVWEWTSSSLGDNRIFRGGSMGSIDSDCAVSIRGDGIPHANYWDIGFRVCR